MSPEDFLLKVIVPTLRVLGLDGPDAEQLLLGTAIQESGINDVVQAGGGPALGYFQIEPNTHNDVWNNYLNSLPILAAKVAKALPEGEGPNPRWLIGFPQYECAIVRIIYERCPGKIPADLEGQAAYYKQYYNTPQGAATTEEYVTRFLAKCGKFPFNGGI